GQREHGRRQDGEGADHDGDDRGHEQREQVPGRGIEPLRPRTEPEGHDEEQGREAGEPGPAGRLHLATLARRTRPERPFARPWTTPSSRAMTYCQVNEYSPAKSA